MPSRGVVFGDVERATLAWNERLDGIAEGQSVEFKPGSTATVQHDTALMLHADLWDVREAEDVFSRLVFSYTGITVDGTLRGLLLGFGLHAGAIGVLTERQRHDGGLSEREAQLEAALREIAENRLSGNGCAKVALAALDA